MLSDKELLLLEPQKRFFIENNRKEATYLDWLRSKGTNFDCYKNYVNSLSAEDRLNNKLDFIRTLVYTLNLPFKSDFFDSIGGLLPRYYANAYIDDLRIDTKCINTLSSETAHPLKWVIMRHIAIIFWYIGEIFGDWYPLLRTKAVINDKKSLLPIYITCGLFNLSKIVLIINHLCLLPNELYDENGVFIMEIRDTFYVYHWLFQFIIICTSLLYDLSVFLVLKKNFFPVYEFDFGFLKKFKTTSEFRILVTAFISIFLLPFAAFTIFLKYYYLITQRMKHVEFSYEDIRFSIANLQYYMIFIDQILLFYSNNEHSNLFSIITKVLLLPLSLPL
ncbi:hypothetical protein BCR32DRAFT_305507 [Anaeromyces robustus]|uniref:Uncharacterized protein n=1 Tax=Anaeromyces robustus TaxID=1754192 RepID=A0A1Y1XH67_9FUNG|nr:hypothetical protein BCR32DRAFT_305507 [Anaeromyces robustus]|eukprot:ORX85075.1 hypothetical protein BCR32DRAFT_305507 [Anaeromyces robustus]